MSLQKDRGVSRSYLSQLEKDKEGVRATTLPKLKGIARAMEISLEELMRTMDDMIINPPKPRPKDEKVESAFRAMSLQPVPIFDPIILRIQPHAFVTYL